MVKRTQRKGYLKYERNEGLEVSNLVKSHPKSFTDKDKMNLYEKQAQFARSIC